MTTKTTGDQDRRQFLKAASGAAASVLLVSPRVAFGAEANEKLRLGLIGCGQRGTWAGNLYQQNTNTKVVAVHDYFRDRVVTAGEALDVPTEKQFTGLDGYKALIESGVDAVAVESPPYFHPEQTVAALNAGKHVYLAKPIGVDVPGCMAIVDAAKLHPNLTTWVDFQTRANGAFQAVAQGVHDGLIGRPAFGHVFYHCGRNRIRTKPEGTAVSRLRNWLFDIPLSGDIIVEQNIHVLDVANWYLQGHPDAAEGTGARTVRTDVGDAWDQYSVTYWYPKDVLVSFSSAQFTHAFTDLCTRLFGSEGTVESHYGGEVELRNRRGGIKSVRTSSIYVEGAIANMKTFHESIRTDAPLNNTVECANSTMTGILGRMAAHTGRKTTWQEMVNANERLDANLELPANGPETEVSFA